MNLLINFFIFFNLTMFRSQKMGYFTLVMPRESVWEILNELGSKGRIQFEDQYQKDQMHDRPQAIVKKINRCKDMEGNIIYIQD